MINPIYDAARDFHARGWSVFPLSRTKGKMPLVKWKRFQSERPTLDEIDEWFKDTPNKNLGVATGALSGFWVLDIDEACGHDFLQEHGGLPHGPCFTTSEEWKVQYLFRWPDGVSVRNGARVIPGCDVRGEGGLIQAPPSVSHKNGRAYEWITTPDEAAIPDAPEWLLDAVLKPVFEPQPAGDVPPLELPSGGLQNGQLKWCETALNNLLEEISHAPDGQKHAELFKKTARAAEFIPHGVISESELQNAVESVILPRAADPDNARKTIRDAIEKGKRNPARLPETNHARVVLLRSSAARSFIQGASTEHAEVAQEKAPESEGADDGERALNEGVYGIQNGRTVLAVVKEKTTETGATGATSKHFVCDFSGFIAEEERDEDGQSTLGLAIRHRSGSRYLVRVPGAKMSDPKFLAGTLYNALGHHSLIYKGMEGHLAPSFLDFSRDHAPELTRLYHRTGWTKEGEFLVPGLAPPDTRLELPRELAYKVEHDSNNDAPELLELFLNAHAPHITTLLTAHLLTAPLASLASWNDEKFVLLMVGQTGALKTSLAQMGMCFYGDFGSDDKLLRFGAGGTVNAMMSYPASAADLPLLIDNFKPGTGSGQKDGQTFIHGLLEGTERKRLNRDGTRRETKELRSWLVFTGEDRIDDAASVARTLEIHVTRPPDADVERLSRVQERSHELPRIGGAWLDWLLSGEAAPVINAEKREVGERRSAWAARLRKANPDMVNVLRVATSLAIIETTWHIALHHPTLGAVLRRWTPQFIEALGVCNGVMANAAASSFEATRYLNALRGLLTGGRAYLQPKANDANPEERRAFLGWEDDERVYIHPELAYNAALESLKHQNGLNGVKQNTISKQLDSLGYLVQKESGHFSVKKRLGSGKPRVLVFDSSRFYGDDDGSELDDD